MFDLIIQQLVSVMAPEPPVFWGHWRHGRPYHVPRPRHGAGRPANPYADGLVLAPGFIDPHTHYDAQIAWDPLLTSSPWQG